MTLYSIPLSRVTRYCAAGEKVPGGVTKVASEFNEEFSQYNQQDVLVELQCLQKQKDVDECSDKLANAIVGKISGLDVNAQPDEMTGYTPYERLTIPLQYVFSTIVRQFINSRKARALPSCQSMGSVAVLCLKRDD